VLGVVLLGGRGVEMPQLERDEPQALALESGDDLTDETAFDAVGLAEDEGAVGARPTLRRTRLPG
jgi:trehalose-6-phosphatase